MIQDVLAFAAQKISEGKKIALYEVNDHETAEVLASLPAWWCR